MAYNGSPDIKPGLSNEYDLGDYTFSVTSAYDSQRNKTDIMAYCGLSDEEISKSAVKTISVDGDATVDNWRVEANEDTASVYAVVKVPSQSGDEHSYMGQTAYSCDPSSVYHKFGEDEEAKKKNDYGYAQVTGQSVVYGVSRSSINSPYAIVQSLYSQSPFTFTYKGYDKAIITGQANGPATTSKGVTYYWTNVGGGFNDNGPYENLEYYPPKSIIDPGICSMADILFLGTSPTEYETKEMLVGRFAIDLAEAGGGPGGGWDIPGDTGDPSYTLHVTVNGASSGTHDDTYNAADNESVKGYGFGGDGGYGGGGGAGASTTIINEFATDKAGYVDQRAYAQSPGLGGMGGKGGKGGDGCILVFY